MRINVYRLINVLYFLEFLLITIANVELSNADC